jgi:hypothetical protein
MALMSRTPRCFAVQVFIDAAVAFVLAVDHSASPSFIRAASAVDQSFQVVEVDSVPISATVPLIQDLLNLKEQLLRDQGFVPTGIELALVAGHARVVRITEYLRELTRGNDSLFEPHRGTGRQTLLVECGLQLRHRVIAAGVLLESPRHQRSPDRISRAPAV